MHYTPGQRSARLAFILPKTNPAPEETVALLELLASQAGKWGACNMLVELDEDSPLFESFRRAGFVVYGRQQVWRISTTEGLGPRNHQSWRPALPINENGIRSLYQSLVPPLVQSAEACPESSDPYLVSGSTQGELLAFTRLWMGPRGIYARLLLHPGVADSAGLLGDLVTRLAPTRSRPLFLAVRSYQAELESGLETLPAGSGPRQVLLVKYLVNLLRTPAFNHNRSVLEPRRAEPTTPIVTQISRQQSAPRPSKDN